MHNSKLTLEQNESGFVRLRIPKNKTAEILRNDDDSPLLPEKLAKIYQLRLNFWPATKPLDTNKDATMHTHPRDFCTYIIAGAYAHEEFVESNLTDTNQAADAYSKYLINKDLRLRSPIKEVSLTSKGEFINSAGDVVNIDSNVIHQVTDYNFLGNTLSLNIVYNCGPGFNYIFLPLYSNSNLVNTQRKTIPQEQQSQHFEEMYETLAVAIAGK